MANTIATNETAGLALAVKDEPTTRDMEALMRHVREGRSGAELSFYESLANMLRAAIKAGLVVEPALSVKDVDNLAPGVTRFYGEALMKWYREVTTVPLV
ncbi:MAG TPA: hypothetical protein PLC98_15845 [Anaerolineales bacterium]|nr:hypothetical protein [Anaerolineales bacterium]